mmetsp:Transcript_43353/g.69793  ORF Transcript_43353/g.69793 Transcript_43353/m.69793 type:complete len:98 (-) Transcript_43353:370-663(-)
METTTVRLFRAISLRSVIVFSAFLESKPEHGSSSSKKFGFVSSSKAIITRFRSPVDKLWLLVVIAVFLHFSRPSSRINSPIRRCLCASLHLSLRQAA